MLCVQLRDLWMDAWQSLSTLSYKEVPRRDGYEHSDELNCSYCTGYNSCPVNLNQQIEPGTDWITAQHITTELARSSWASVLSDKVGQWLLNMPYQWW